MKPETNNVLGFNSLVNSIKPLTPKSINLRSILLGLWSYVIFKLFAADHMWISTYSYGCHAQYNWTNVSTSQINARYLSCPWRCNTKVFLSETAEIFTPLICVKTHIDGTFNFYLAIQSFVYSCHPPMHVIYFTHIVFSSLIFLIYMKNSNY
jgi:hypothetical protein